MEECKLRSCSDEIQHVACVVQLDDDRQNSLKTGTQEADTDRGLGELLLNP